MRKTRSADYKLGYKAGKSQMARESNVKIRELEARLETCHEINAYEHARADRLERALRSYARDVIDETRPHPFKELRP